MPAIPKKSLSLIALLVATACNPASGTHGASSGQPDTLGAASAAPSAPSSAAPAASGSAETPRPKSLVYARAMEVWIHEEPRSASAKLGYLRAGAAVEALGDAKPGEGCPGGFLPIAPRGYVCMAATAVTKDSADPIVRASQRRPDRSKGLPYGYAVVRNSGAPFYTRVPTETEAKGLEQDWDTHFASLAQAEEKEAREGAYPQLASMPNGALPKEPTPGVLAAWATDGKDDDWAAFLGPSFLEKRETVPDLANLAMLRKHEACTPQATARGEKTCIPLDAARPIKRLGISFVGSFESTEGKGRRYYLTPDLVLMPADRVRLVRGTAFQGTELGPSANTASADEKKPLKLPIVFVIHENIKRLTLEGKKVKEGEVLPFRVALEATQKERVVGGKHYHVLASGDLVATKDAVRLDPIRKMPKWGKEGERWIEINLTKQTLLAVDGTTPVYATLVSTGAGGSSEDTEKNPYLTPRGIFRIHTKHVASTMDSKQPEAEFELRDVPYIQYFKDGYALHAAYWHDQFGLPRSHGCINLAPKDAARLFAFTKPEVPESWHGAMLALKGTVVWVHP
jgi:L,D-transpeptidase catalytic domain